MASTPSTISAPGNALSPAARSAPAPEAGENKAVGGIPCRDSEQPERLASYPTVLVGVEDGELRQLFVEKLRKDDFLVLEADSSHSVLEVVIQHSRSIHVPLLETRIGDPEFVALLSRFRSYMQVFFVTTCSSEDQSHGLSPDYALANTRELLKPLKEIATGAA